MTTHEHKLIMVDRPGYDRLELGHLVLDFNGTLALDGQLLPGVRERLLDMAQQIAITIMTADTHGSAHRVLHDLPVKLVIVGDGFTKADHVQRLGPERVVVIGNGRNDSAMAQAAALSIGVIGPEGLACDLVQTCDVIVNDIHAAFDLLARPVRLTATLRD